MRGLDELFRNIEINDYEWYIDEYEIIKEENEQCKNMHFSSHLKEDEFLKLIHEPSCLIISVNIQAYPSHKTKKHVVTYEDFQNSDCELMLLITDVKYVEVYAKSKSVIMNIIENAENCGCSEITIKTDKEDGRTRLSVM